MGQDSVVLSQVGSIGSWAESSALEVTLGSIQAIIFSQALFGVDKIRYQGFPPSPASEGETENQTPCQLALIGPCFSRVLCTWWAR